MQCYSLEIFSREGALAKGTPEDSILFFFFFNSYLFIHERHRERQRQTHRQREKQAPYREPDVGLDPESPGSHPGPKADTQLLSHPGIPPRIGFLLKAGWGS